MQKRHWKQLVRKYASLCAQWKQAKNKREKELINNKINGFIDAACIAMGTSFGTWKTWASHDSNGELSREQRMYNIGKLIGAQQQLRTNI